MSLTHNSNSSVQNLAEVEALAILETQLNCKFEKDARLPIEAKVQLDGIDPNKRIIVEVYSRIGITKGGQTNKIKGDILKFALIDKYLDDKWRKILCFTSEETAKKFRGSSWIALAVKAFNIEIIVVELSMEMQDSLREVQKRQKMVNPIKTNNL